MDSFIIAKTTLLDPDVLMVILSAIYGILAYLMLRSSDKSIEEMRIARESEVRPQILVYLQVVENGDVSMILENVGKEMAFNVKFLIDENCSLHSLLNPYLLEQGICNFAPQFKINTPLGNKESVSRGSDGKFKVFKLDITYTGKDVSQKYEDVYCLDLNIFS